MSNDSNNTERGWEESSVALTGDYTHGIDDKQRLIIPSRWRQALGNPKTLCLMPNLDNERKCLLLMSEREYSRRSKKSAAAALGDAEAMDLMVNLGALTDTPLLDSHGRVRICEWQLLHAGITKQIRMIGAGSIAQLWNPEDCDVAPLSKLSALGKLSKTYGF